jgi:ferredoxin/flavodoxin---NADP+ reductase
MSTQAKYLVAVIGAGPAGIFAARELANQNAHVVLINRDIKPGGLAEYGIYPDKHKMKDGLRTQFHQILANDGIDYYGNLMVGEHADLKIDELRAMGFQAILVTAGAQATKWLGLPGESLEGVYHAKDLVYHYNQLPPFSQRKFHLGRRVAVVGAGNVMLDITHYLSSLPQVEEIYAVIRRGPAEIKFTRVELEYVAKLLDLDDFQSELTRATPLMSRLSQDPTEVQTFIQQALYRSSEISSRAHFRLRFLVSPTRITGDENGHVNGLEVEDNTLYIENDEVKARSLGTHRMLDVDTVIFAIGDRVDDAFGIPVKGPEFIKSVEPRFPIEGTSYEVYDPETKYPIDGLFVAGWARKASSGLVGVARKDGTNGARAVLSYLKTLSPMENLPLEMINQRLYQVRCPLITKVELAQLEKIEQQVAQKMGLPDFKFSTNQGMLAAVGFLPEVLSVSEGSLR